MASLRDAKAVVEEGGCTIWVQLPDIPYKYDKFGLGFTSGAQKSVRRARAGERLYGSATMGSTQGRIVMTVVTWKNGFFQLSTEDSTTRKPKNLSLLLLSNSNCL